MFQRRQASGIEFARFNTEPLRKTPARGEQIADHRQRAGVLKQHCGPTVAQGQHDT